MANMKQLAEALKMAEKLGYKVNTPAQQTPQRKSLVEYNRQAPRKTAFVERVSSYNFEDLANRETPLPANTSIEQLLQDFSLLYLYSRGHYDEV